MLKHNIIEDDDGFIIEYNLAAVEVDKKDFTSFEHIDNLVELYTKKINTIAMQLSEDGGFLMFYGKYKPENIIPILGKPSIRYFKDGDSGVISYINQGFDDCHIIDIEFDGLMESFYNVSIDG